MTTRRPKRLNEQTNNQPYKSARRFGHFSRSTFCDGRFLEKKTLEFSPAISFDVPNKAFDGFAAYCLESGQKKAFVASGVNGLMV